MPMIDLTVQNGTLTQSQQERLHDTLIKLIIKYERGDQPLPGYEYASRMFLHFAESVSIAGRIQPPTVSQLIKCIISTPKGSLNAERKADCGQEVVDAILDITGRGDRDDDHERIWVIWNDVPDSDWRVGNHVVTLRALAKRFKVNPDSDRYKELVFEAR